ncbi:MAG TPA: Gfo/Idh/MocA family oxidoreductase [Actinomycetota bacterium]
MTDEASIRVGLVGFGLGGAVFHAPLISATPGLELVAIVTRDPGRTATARSRYPNARVVADAAQLWEADDLDLVVISTHNSAHVPLGIAALEAGLPVVMDKPLAPTSAQGQRLVDESVARGLMLSVFQNRRWDSDFLTLRAVLDEGAIGTPTRFESRYERWRPSLTTDSWRERPGTEEAGGLLFDLGSHLIDQAIQLFGRPTEVYAELDQRRPGAAVDDDAFVALTHSNGVRSHLWMSAVARLHGPRFKLLGLAGGFESFGLDGQEDALAAGGDASDPAWGTEPSDRWATLATDQGERRVESHRGNYPAFYAGVERALRTGKNAPVDPRDSVDGLHVIEAAARSAAEGDVVTVDRWSHD